jgi:hypothetical protein
VPDSRSWEVAVRAPGTVASLPFSIVGLGVKGALVFVEEKDVISKVLARVSLLAISGFLISPASLGDATGWGAEFGYSPPFFRSFYTKVSGSTAGYNRTEVALEASEGLIEYQYDWRPSDPFFGIGPNSSENQRSNFALKSEAVRLELRYPFRRLITEDRDEAEAPEEAAQTETSTPPAYLIRVWTGPRDVVVHEGRERTDDDLPVSERFPSFIASQLGTHVEHFVYGAKASYDRRSGHPHWWKGWRVASSIERFDEPVKAFAFHNASTPSVPFTRLIHEAELGLSFWRDPRTFRFYGRVEDLRDIGSSGVFPLSDLSVLGGRAGLSGFEPGRFRDNDLVLGRITYIFPIARYFEMDLHSEAGQVASRVSDVRLSDFESSYGVALRGRTAWAPLASVGVDWSRETARIRFAVGGVE